MAKRNRTCFTKDPNKLINDFIRKARLKHGDIYDYSLVKYTNCFEQVDILCNKHGIFKMRPHDHISGGCGCPKCWEERKVELCKSKTEKTASNYIEKCRSIHGDKYDYSLTKFTGWRNKITIICKEHGSWETLPQGHLDGHGCNLCGNTIISQKKRKPNDEFIRQAKLVHGDIYDYSLVDYKTNGSMNDGNTVKIICKNHGVFEQLPIVHLKGHGCPRCNCNIQSSGEVEVLEFVKSLGLEIIERCKDIIKPKEIDIYIPEKKVAIEYNGLYWHSSKIKTDKKYHQNKSLACEDIGIRLIHVWEHQWVDERQREILKNIIKSACGIYDKRIYARDCEKIIVNLETCKELEKQKYTRFFENNNINGWRGAKILVGLEYEGMLIHAFTFGHAYFGKGKYEWELIRGVSKLGYQIIGGSSRLWEYFIEKYNPTSIVYYCDFNYFLGKSIEILKGIELEKYSSPGIWNWWVKENIVKNREPHRHKEIKELEEKGEVIPLYNSGTKVFVYRK